MLAASARVEAEDARRIAAVLNAAVPHRNTDRRERECARSAETRKSDALLLAHSPTDRAIVELAFSGCSGRGLSNGRDNAQITQSLLAELMTPLHIVYGTDVLPP